MVRHCLVIVALLLTSGAVAAATLNVPADYATIQAAIDAAAPGDEIVIAAGTYEVAAPHLLPPGGLSVLGKGEVVLTGSTGAFFEVVDPQNLDLFRFEHLRFADNPVGIRTPVPVNPFPETRLEVENCEFFQNGVGISARNTGQFRLTNCRFEGGDIGVDLRFAWMLAADCVFIGPEVAIYSDEGQADRLVERCLFVDCYGLYGAVSLDGDAYFILNQCTFDRCGATDGAAISSRQGATVVLDRCIVANGPGLAFGCIGGLENLFIITCSDLWNNADGNWHGCGYGEPEENGNFSADPRFCEPGAEDYTIDGGSPCAPANNGCEELIGAYKVGCDVTATPSASISAVKSLY